MKFCYKHNKSSEKGWKKHGFTKEVGDVFGGARHKKDECGYTMGAKQGEQKKIEETISHLGQYTGSITLNEYEIEVRRDTQTSRMILILSINGDKKYIFSVRGNRNTVESTIEFLEKRGFVKRCKCGVIHTKETWQKLQYVGIQDGLKKDEKYELRNCKCNSTIAWKI